MFIELNELSKERESNVKSVWTNLMTQMSKLQALCDLSAGVSGQRPMSMFDKNNALAEFLLLQESQRNESRRKVLPDCLHKTEHKKFRA